MFMQQNCGKTKQHLKSFSFNDMKQKCVVKDWLTKCFYQV